MIGIAIYFKFKDGPWGGGNQFLKALAKRWQSQGVLASSVAKADAVLFNGHLKGAGEGEVLAEVTRLRRQYPERVLVHRIDGPLSLYQGVINPADRRMYKVNAAVVDGTIFQSEWSRRENKRLGMKDSTLEKVIPNAPDPRIFNSAGKVPFSPDRKTRLIATSWSANWRKGFATYQWLDTHLDFSKYSMTFVGNSPTGFKNIEHKKPMASEDLAQELKQHDIYITASHSDPCSNSLLEALHCGLPALAYKDGGHPELVKSGGELFGSLAEITDKLELLRDSYSRYQQSIKVPDLEMVADQYTEFIEDLHKSISEGSYTTQKIDLGKYLYLRASLSVGDFLSRVRKKLQMR